MNERDDFNFVEHGVLASILRDNANAVLVDLKPEDFAIADNGRIYAAMLELIREGLPVEPAVLADRLGGGGKYAALLDIILNDAIYTQPIAYADAIKRRSNAARARTIGRALAETGDMDVALRDLHGLSIGEQRFMHDGRTLVDEAIRSLDEGVIRGVSTGFERYDGRFGGMHPGDLIVVGARPAVGKTALMLNIAYNSNVPVVIFSGEQPARQCQERLIASVGSVPFEKIRTRSLDQFHWEAVTRARNKLRERKYWIFDKAAPSLADIHRETRKHHREHGVQLVMLDYLQRMKRDGDQPMHEQVGRNIQGLKELARDLDVPVVCLAQVNRRVDTRDDKMPTMADLKDSGTIEQEADVIVMLARERATDRNATSRIAEMYVAKNRHGPTGLVRLVYVEEYLRFENAERSDYGSAA